MSVCVYCLPAAVRCNTQSCVALQHCAHNSGLASTSHLGWTICAASWTCSWRLATGRHLLATGSFGATLAATEPETAPGELEPEHELEASLPACSSRGAIFVASDGQTDTAATEI